MQLEIASALLIASLGSAQTGVISLAPTGDATADASQPAVNFGAGAELNFGKVALAMTNGFTATIF
jgi:hypothetical protein